MSKYLCKNCGKEITENMKFCKYCGVHLQVVKSICPTCHHEYDESTNFCPTCASRCVKKQVFEGKIIEEVKPLNKEQVNIKPFNVVEEASNNKVIKRIFWIFGIVNVCLVGLSFLLLALVPLNDATSPNSSYSTFFIFLFQALFAYLKYVGSYGSFVLYIFYIVVLLALVLTMLISELVTAIKLINGNYQNIFLNSFSKNFNIINSKVLLFIAIFAFSSMFNIFNFSLNHNINPTFIMMPLFITSTSYVIVGMVFKHKMLQKMEPMKIVPKALLIHRIMYLVCSFMVIFCFVIYLMLIKSITNDYYDATHASGLYSFLQRCLLGDLLGKFNFGFYPLIAYASGCAFYQLIVVPLAQIVLGIFRVIGFSKQNEIQNQLYNNGKMGAKFAFMCVLMGFVTFISLSTLDYVSEILTILIVFAMLFMILLGLVIAINVIEKKAQKALKETN